MERLTPLAESELEIASLRRQVREFQQEIDGIRTEYEDLEAEQKAKHEIIERLSNDLSTRDLEIDSYKERIVQLQGLLEDSLPKRHEEIRAFNQRYRLEVADTRKVMDKESGPAPLAAFKKAETKERANPQLEQSGSHNHAEELESQKTSNDTTEEEFENKEALG